MVSLSLSLIRCRFVLPNVQIILVCRVFHLNKINGIKEEKSNEYRLTVPNQCRVKFVVRVH